jgi:hypothetical protein
VILGVWLSVVGVCDLMRAAQDTTSWRRRAVLAAFGCTLLCIAGLALGFTLTWWLTVGVLWTTSLLGWVLASSLALNPSSPRHAGWRAAAFGSFTMALVVLTFLWDTAPQTPALPTRWDSTLVGDVGPTRLVLCAGVALFELSTANLLVRLLLDATGVPAARNEGDLSGGRVLGPMERVFILVLALTGEVTAASVVVAAKGLLRYPELRRSRDEGPTAVSEYILIGSFASWLLGVLGWLLTLR